MSESNSLRATLRSLNIRTYTAIEHAIDRIDSHIARGTPFSVILNLPTGYGKTNLSIILGRHIMENSLSLFERIIHVIPTRFLADDIFHRAQSHGVSSAVQYMWAEPTVKAPYFIHRYVISTYDSFMLNYYKACVAKIRSEHGHFEIPRYAVLSSLTFFDEYHLFTPGDTSLETELREFHRKSWTALTRTLKQLYEASVPVILSTATCIEHVQNEILRIASEYTPGNYKIYVFNLSCSDNYTKSGEKIEIINVKDEDFVNKFGNINVRTYLGQVNTRDDFINAALNILHGFRGINKKVKKVKLVVCDTVSLAQDAYQSLRDKLDEKVLLIHSRFTVGDRAHKQELIQRGEVDVVVATQVVEVGVNIDACLLVSEISPLVSLVQRCGRVAREGDINEAYVYVMYIKENERGDSYSGVYDLYLTSNTYQALASLGSSSQSSQTRGGVSFRECRVQWRLPCDLPRGFKSYVKLANRIYSEVDLSIDEEYDLLLKTIDESLLIDKPIVNDLLERICNFVRDSIVLSIYVPPKGVNRYEELLSYFRRGVSSREIIKNVVPIELRLIPRLIESGVLMTRGRALVAVFEHARSGEMTVMESRRLYELLSDFERYRCYLTDYVEHRGEDPYYLVALVALSDKYDSETGLRVG